MSKICALRPWEGDRLFSKGTQPKCENHVHIPLREARTIAANFDGYFTDDRQRQIVVREERMWRVIASVWQFVTIRTRGPGRQVARQNKTKLPYAAQGRSGPIRTISTGETVA